MSAIRHLVSLLALLLLFPLLAPGQSIQSTMEFQAGTNIEVTAGADICADIVIINGTFSGGGTKCGGPLPVEMSSMSAQVSRQSVTITWTTLSETNSYGFAVQRRNEKNESANFDSIGFVKGAGTSLAVHTYSFVDEAVPSGQYVYRLKQLDLDGTFKYYETLEVEVPRAAASEAIPTDFSLSQNYPNPFNPTTVITVGLPRDASVSLVVYSTLGQKVAQLLDCSMTAGYYDVVFDASQLASGLYLYRLKAGDYVATKKMLVTK
jgi:hypothetical protein